MSPRADYPAGDEFDGLHVAAYVEGQLMVEMLRRCGADVTRKYMVQVSLNRGAMPHEMFIEQIRRFARNVLPALQAHRVECVPAAEEMATLRT
jgi:hypothetical protein